MPEYKRHLLGRTAEKQAIRILKKAGYRILERNFSCPIGELDIIAKHRDTLVFVEVRARSSTEYGLPKESIDKRKQKKIQRVAEYYLLTRRLPQLPCRFDVISLIQTEDGWEHELIQNAFP